MNHHVRGDEDNIQNKENEESMTCDSQPDRFYLERRFSPAALAFLLKHGLPRYRHIWQCSCLWGPCSTRSSCRSLPSSCSLQSLPPAAMSLSWTLLFILYPKFNALQNYVPPWWGSIVSGMTFREEELKWATVVIFAFSTFLPKSADEKFNNKWVCESIKISCCTFCEQSVPSCQTKSKHDVKSNLFCNHGTWTWPWPSP